MTAGSSSLSNTHASSLSVASGVAGVPSPFEGTTPSPSSAGAGRVGDGVDGGGSALYAVEADGGSTGAPAPTAAGSRYLSYSSAGTNDLTISRPGASAAMPRSSSVSTTPSARRTRSSALSLMGLGSCISVFSSPGACASTPRSWPFCRRSRASVAPPRASRGPMTAAARGSFMMRSSGDGLLGGDSNVDAPSEEEEAGVSPDGPSPAARGGGAKRRPAGFARRLLTAADTTFTDVMSDAIVPCLFPSGALRSVSGRTWELSLSRSRSRRLGKISTRGG